MPALSDAEPAPLVHGLVRLRRDGSAIGLAVAWRPADADVQRVGDLPAHAVEIHVFRGNEARVFAEGINYAGGNAASAADFENIVIVARFDAERSAAAMTLEAALPLHDRTDGMIEGARSWASAREASQARRDTEENARKVVDRLWEPTLVALAAFPRDARGRPVLEPQTNGRTAETLFVDGTFDSAHPYDRFGSSEHHFTASLTLQPDQTIRVSAAYILHATPAGFLHRRDAIHAACAEGGFECDEATMQPSKVTAPGEALHAALRALPGVHRRVAALAEAGERVAQAEALLGERDLMRTLTDLVEGAYITQFSGGKPARLVGADGKGRGLTGMVVRRLAKLDFIDKFPQRTTPGGGGYDFRWNPTALARMAVARDAEALADAMKERRTLSSD